jgi:RimJ/RimL family protein N-acetyltransferase
MEIILQKATRPQLPQIWEILQQAIAQRKADGSTQWQNGYPNEKTIEEDMAAGRGYVFLNNNGVIAYIVIISGVEIPYNTIVGNWLTEDSYVTLHRLAISNAVKGKGLATTLFELVEAYCREQQAPSIRFDTSADNRQMRKIADRLGYTYCGTVLQSGAPRRAYEKVLRAL